MRVLTQKIGAYMAVVYDYKVPGGMGFRFHCLHEVGAPYQEQARVMAIELAKKRGRTLRTVITTEKPYVFDALVAEHK